MYDFTGKIALVTGAGGGMGLAAALGLLTAGARVALMDLKPEPAELEPFAGRYRYARIDLTDETQLQSAFEEIRSEFGGLHYLCNVAGVIWFDRDESALDIDLETWDRVMTINLRSMVQTVRRAVPLMKLTDGDRAMVHFSTIQWLRGDRSPQDAYQASKAAVCALSKSLAIQLADVGIRSNTIMPGATLTPMQERWRDKEDILSAISASVPLGRIGQPEDMANACLFLLSSAASYITGVDLPVDGGLLAKPPS
jgi:3-oxoacyl-[acyl-carrier protein] reductase